jgi:hypothetical protein
VVSQASLMECDLKANGLRTHLSLAESRLRKRLFGRPKRSLNSTGNRTTLTSLARRLMLRRATGNLPYFPGASPWVAAHHKCVPHRRGRAHEILRR